MQKQLLTLRFDCSIQNKEPLKKKQIRVTNQIKEELDNKGSLVK